jgi:hypothetical protein
MIGFLAASFIFTKLFLKGFSIFDASFYNLTQVMMRRIIFAAISTLLISYIIIPVYGTNLFHELKAIQVNTNDTFIAYKATSVPVIDGKADEDFWSTATWYPLDHVWLPYNAVVDPDDFTGRFKISWTDERLLLLVEVIDDSLHDGHVNPLQNYWDDDCVEVFLDENKSGGNHLNNFNAFAYHVSITYDVVDNGLSGAALFNDHIETVRTREGKKHLWELSIKVFDDTYVHNGTSTPVTLHHDKKMGFSLAYCDTDGSPSRENFIGSKYLPQNQSNNSYIDASLFGTLFLKDPSISSRNEKNVKTAGFFPNPADGLLNYSFTKDIPAGSVIQVLTLNGQVILSEKLNSGTKHGSISIEKIKTGGMYIIEVRNSDTVLSTERIFLNRN